jgi:transcriptional regulator NrdR family protein
MRCPLCGKDEGSRVTRTIRCNDGVIRERVCFNCHTLFTTIEKADDHQAAAKN